MSMHETKEHTQKQSITNFMFKVMAALSNDFLSGFHYTHLAYFLIHQVQLLLLLMEMSTWCNYHQGQRSVINYDDLTLKINTKIIFIS